MKHHFLNYSRRGREKKPREISRIVLTRHLVESWHTILTRMHFVKGGKLTSSQFVRTPRNEAQTLKRMSGQRKLTSFWCFPPRTRLPATLKCWSLKSALPQFFHDIKHSFLVSTLDTIAVPAPSLAHERVQIFHLTVFVQQRNTISAADLFFLFVSLSTIFRILHPSLKTNLSEDLSTLHLFGRGRSRLIFTWKLSEKCNKQKSFR